MTTRSATTLALILTLAATGAEAEFGQRLRGERPGGARSGALRQQVIDSAREKARARIEAAIAARVRAVQQALNYFGFDAGPADGAYGERTKAAVADYAQFIGYPPLPVLGPIQIDYLLAVEAQARGGSAQVTALLETLDGAPRSLLRAYLADPVDTVLPDPARINTRTVQATLNALGHDAGKIDGQTGPATRAAIDSWRAENGSAATGPLSNDEKVALVLENWRRLSRRVPLPRALHKPQDDAQRNTLAALYPLAHPGADAAPIDRESAPYALATAALQAESQRPALFVLWQDPAGCAETPCTLELWLDAAGPGAEGGAYEMLGSFPYSASLELGGDSHGGMRDIWIDGSLMRWTGSAYSDDTSLAAPADRSFELDPAMLEQLGGSDLLEQFR